MAEVNGRVSLAQQIGLVAKLRWRILLNGLRKKNNVLDLIGMGFAALFGAIVVIGPALGFYFAGYSFISGGRLQSLALPFWLIFVFWQVIPIFAAGFGTRFEFRTLLRFPFNASAFYLIGLAYGLADFPALASICWLLALTAGASVAMPSLLPMMLVVIVLFIVLNVTMERLAGSWLEKLLARRRSREIFFALFILLMFSMQFISPLQRKFIRKENSAALIGLVKYLTPFPPSLLARAIAGALRHEVFNIAVGLTGTMAFIVVFTALLWQRLEAQYRGEELSESESATAGGSTRVAGVNANTGGARRQTTAGMTDTVRFFPGLVSPAVGAMLRKEYAYFVRNGFACLLLVLPPAQVLLFGSRFAGKNSILGGRAINTDYLFPAMMAYTILILMAPAYNAFAYESRGIQTYFTAPLKFADIFAGKNLVTAIVISFEVTLCGAVLAWMTGVPSVSTLFATVFALVFTVAAQLPVANWVSLSFPRKLDFGSMRNQRNSGVAIWIMFGMQILIAGISALVLWTGRLTGNPWLAAGAFAILASAALGGYFASLQPLTEFAEKKKETLIEALCR